MNILESNLRPSFLFFRGGCRETQVEAVAAVGQRPRQRVGRDHAEAVHLWEREAKGGKSC